MSGGLEVEAQEISTKPRMLEGRTLTTGGRLLKTPKRKLKLGGQGNKHTPISRLAFGVGAAREVLTARACIGTSSPKRQIPMDVDSPVPPKRKRRTSKLVIPANQQLITDVWGKKQ